jgi:spore_V_T: stage V sporulation protein T
MFRVR